MSQSLIDEDEMRKSCDREFAKHVASYKEYGHVKEITWAEPDTFINAMRYLHDGKYVYISGDWGFATYNMYGGNHGFYWLANSHYSYLREKLVACSESINDNLGLAWSEKWATRNTNEIFFRALRTNESFRKLDRESRKAKIEQYKNLRNEIRCYASNAHEFLSALYRNIDEIEELIGDPWYEYLPPSTGQVAHIRMIGQLYGLKLALEDLKRQGIEV